MPKISVPQKQIILDVAPGKNLMNALLEADIPVASSCHGEGVCSMCRVKLEGEAAAPEQFEIECLKRNKAEPGERLSCQVTVNSDILVSTKYW